MSDPTIFVCRPKSVSATDKAKLTKLGIVVIEMDEPKEFKFIKAGLEISSSGMLMAALEALNSQAGENTNGYITVAGKQREKFMQLLMPILKASAP